MKIKLHRINEHYLIPILFCYGISFLLALMYFINEYFKLNDEFMNYYLFDANAEDLYRSKLKTIIFFIITQLLLNVIVLKFKHWIFSSSLLIIYTILIVLYIMY